MFSVTINGKTAPAEEGQSILAAARAAGITIPTLCYHPDLSVVGSCRLCLVDVDGHSGHVPACPQPVSAGMVIHTESAEIVTARRLVLDLGLAHGLAFLTAYAWDLEDKESGFGSDGDGAEDAFRATGDPDVRAAEDVAKKARNKNIDGVTLAYFDLTRSCVRCHQHLREVRDARLPGGCEDTVAALTTNVTDDGDGASFVGLSDDTSCHVRLRHVIL